MNIQKSNIRKLSVADLEVFDAVYRRASVSGAATELGRPQPSVSNALRVMRALLDDALFIRDKKGMSPTPKAITLAPHVRDALQALIAGAAQADGFDPSQYRRVFNVFMTDIAEAVLLPRLMAAAAAIAPDIGVKTVRALDEDVAQSLAHGRTDLAIGFMPRLDREFDRVSLFHTDYVCIVGKNSQYWSEPLSIRKFRKARHAFARLPGTGHDKLAACFSDLGIDDRLAVEAPSFLALPAIAAGTDIIATAPRPLAHLAARSTSIKVHQHPAEVPPVEVSLYWRRRAAADPALAWLSELCRDVFSPEEMADLLGEVSTQG